MVAKIGGCGDGQAASPAARPVRQQQNANIHPLRIGTDCIESTYADTEYPANHPSAP